MPCAMPVCKPTAAVISCRSWSVTQREAVAAAERICETGYWVKAVRPPTVPAGTSRLRLSLNAAMDWEQLAPLPAIIKESLG